VTWQDYEACLESNLQGLHERVHRGAYRALPSRRKYIPKPDGRQRPLGIASLEDKVLQRAVVAVLNAIYEEDFLGFFVWIPTEAQSARRLRRADGRYPASESELDTRCRLPKLFRRGKS